ncbi:hypothetical protein A1359_03725 [Methylomonas lenta]|uniref:PNPLA domain-containing protein n=1 Tax=Methylomonas lenta TaxID=980561 RepID=A0A177NQ22_9GAMM|nr:patatin-like phospholipase family protein [Methylomonas lenta]OAI19413.1 hypothetical protein A1359_03725 [Methylomonas lenta]
MRNKTFELGLVGAGAISAGAYTAGVIDFLIQALDTWYDLKSKNENVPQHDVKISVFSGASAGAMTAAIAAAYMGSNQHPVINEVDEKSELGTQNKLFDSWVNRIDIKKLLEAKDLPEGNNVLSLLDSSVLPEIANSGLDVTPRQIRRPYIPDNFELLLTVTNLRGVPYEFELIGDHAKNYDMTIHADYVHFRINDAGEDWLSDRVLMRWGEFGESSPIKEKLKLSAIASGAFPVGLAPRTLFHSIAPKTDYGDCYSSRTWPIPTPESKHPHQCITMAPIEASWGQTDKPFIYDFQCVDGGVMNNEPLELARRILSGGAARNERSGTLADKAILLIDPFPNYSPFELKYQPASDLFSVVFKLFDALKNQARFKPDELALAGNTDVYSRFMIAPKRNGSNGETYPIACGLLGGFGGFLSRKFRSHDFFLGRRNAQKFLKDHLVLPENNKLFDDWDADLKQRYCVKSTDNQPVFKDGYRLLPVIPLVDGLSECVEPKWPTYTYDELNILTTQIESRVNVVFDRLVAQYFKSNNPIVRFIAKMIIGQKKTAAVEYVRQIVKDDLIKMELIEEIK